MHSSRRLIAIAMTSALSLAVASPAQAQTTFQNQQLVVEGDAKRLDFKKRGPVNRLFVDVITNYAGSGTPIDRKATNTKIYFPKDFWFSSRGLAQCDPNALGFGTSTTGSAMQMCGPARVGSGSAELVGAVPGVTAVVTAFNGTRVGGRDTILLHSRTSAGTTTVLVGTLKPSDRAGFGRMLDVPVPILIGGTFAISDFRTTIPRVKLPLGKKLKRNFAKKRKRCKQASSRAKRSRCLKGINRKQSVAKKRFYVMSSCRSGNWTFQALTTYDTGHSTLATATDTCLQPTLKQRFAKQRKQCKKVRNKAKRARCITKVNRRFAAAKRRQR